MVTSHIYLEGDDYRRLQECIHCGLCLSACPTYLVTGVEADSPRGRLALMRALDLGEVPQSAAFTHLDLCLGCLGCQTACPAGVSYGHLLEKTKAIRRPALWIRWALAAVTAPVPLRLLTAWLRLLQTIRLDRLLVRFPLLPQLMRMQLRGLPRLKGLPFTSRTEQVLPAAHPAGLRLGRVALVTGCVMDRWYQPVHAATTRLLRWNGFEVVIPPGQGCCGALHAHAGLLGEADELLKRNRDALAGMEAQAVIVNAAGCGAQLADKLWSDVEGPPVVDPSVFLTEHPLEPPRYKLPEITTYDAACHLYHAQGVQSAPEQLLELACATVEILPDADQCCGSAGLYSLLQGQMSRKVLALKVEQLSRLKATKLVTTNPGCQMQLQAGLQAAGIPMAVDHLGELLDRAYRRDPAYRQTFNLSDQAT